MKGLTFTPENALAVCEGRKVQTRRLSGLAEINAAPEDWQRSLAHPQEYIFRRESMDYIKAKPA